MNKKLSFQLPAGMKDLLPGEAKLKRSLENILVEKFENWGYQEVVTPVLEYYNSSLVEETSGDHFFKLIDRQGQILAMRTDMTTPIARLVASRLSSSQLPLRLFYAANVFRYENPQVGRQREFYQAGVEFVGDQSPAADAEVIALAVECLKQSGLEGFQISIGQVDFIRGIIESLTVESEVKEKIIRSITVKDFVELEILLETYKIDNKIKSLILSLPSLRGDISVIDKAAALVENNTTRAALDNLREVFRLLKVYGVEKEVFVDFGIMRDFDYYTGIVFEGYSPGVGVPICGGGRYDNLLGRYGFSSPATGFAIGLERLMLALEVQKKSDKSCTIDYLVVSSDQAKAIEKAQELRKQGYSVQISNSKKADANFARNILEV